jgi:hypothetical protein
MHYHLTTSRILPKCGIRFDDLTVNALKYDPWGSYGQSKLANLVSDSRLARARALRVHLKAWCSHPALHRPPAPPPHLPHPQLFARELAKRLPAGQTANAVHPVSGTSISRPSHVPVAPVLSSCDAICPNRKQGVANTELGRSMGLGSVAKFFVSAVVGPIAMKSPQECAATQTFMAVSANI